MSVKLHIKKGDTVIVNAGDSKGQTGKVLKVLVEKERAIVEGVNMVSKHTKPNAKNPQGGIVKQGGLDPHLEPAACRREKRQGDPCGPQAGCRRQISTLFKKVRGGD